MSAQLVDLQLVGCETATRLRSEVQRIPPLSAPPRGERMQCKCGNDHFFVSKVDFTCTVCFKSYRD